jgi:LAO/AO transport system kinase
MGRCMGIVTQALSGERRAIARLITVMESGGEQARQALAELYPHTGRAHIVGVTGAPGTGKSTLVNEMAKAYRKQGLKVGIIAVDPTSPFSGGAILGDRIRMRDVATDPGIFIRSMATRGSLGGLARATADAAHVLDAAGYPVILIETVGAGQSEVDIARTAHTTLVVEMPAAGDDIQAIKAGILEIADILVVNKADLAGAEHAVAALQAMLDLNAAQDYVHHGRLEHVEAVVSGSHDGATGGRARWRPPVLKTVATNGEGVGEVVACLQAHRLYLLESGLQQHRERERAEEGLRRILRYVLLEHLLSRIPAKVLDETVQCITRHELDPYSAANALIAELGLAERQV